eukprot:CAMPEP_0181383122 /NCGR_PEP_ID=MMETSP1106-20121128/21166_1 /TAXON_ID=81844 /ORGANISM="Mantoniella antarctica, Strain SL-175" /LENGTH=383 /DNA_ID=CAMNT_0023502711 /DNA_START=185 /DNA_END=1332 /DNA_ORIENTATION=+
MAAAMTEVEFKRQCEVTVREFFSHGVVSDAEESLRQLLSRAVTGRGGDASGYAAERPCGPAVASSRSDYGTGGEGEALEVQVTAVHVCGNAADALRSVSRPPPLIGCDVRSWHLLSNEHPPPSPPHPTPPPLLPPPPPPLPKLGADRLTPMVVKRAVMTALDRGGREREMAAQLLRTLRAHGVVSQPRAEAGFDLILQDVDSLAIDVPAAPDDLAVFLARAVVDGVVSRAYLDECADAAGLDGAPRGVALSARGALSAPGGAVHVRMAWGGPEGATAGAACREMDLLLEEFVSSRDTREAFRRLAALAVPFYHHEFVARALRLSVDQARLDPRCPRRVMELLGYLGNTGLVNGTQFAKGFARVATGLKGMVLDVPDARERFEA